MSFEVTDLNINNPLWVVHIGNNDRIALRAQDEGFVCIGWTKMGSLDQYKSREEMKLAMQETYPDWSNGRVRSSYGQPFRFAHEMQINDLIIYPVKPSGEIGIGRISGEYAWRNLDQDLFENDYCNVRPIEWLNFIPRTSFSQSALHSFGSFSSVSTSSDYMEEVLALIEGSSAGGGEKAIELSIAQEDNENINLYETVSQETEDYLLKAWRNTGTKFEHLVSAIFEAIGYKSRVTKASTDHGIDIIAHPDPLGLERPYIKIQVKSGVTTIGEPDVNQLRGLLNAGESGIFVSLSKYSSSALSVERNSSNITLLGPKEIVSLFLDHYDKLDPTIRSKYPLKQVYVPVS